MKPSGFTMSLGSRPAPPPPRNPPSSSLTGPSRSRLADDSDSEPEDSTHGKVSQVAAFDKKKGAISLDDDSNKKSPLVIPSLKNKDWREESLKRKRHQVWMPSEARSGAQGTGEGERGSSETVGENTGVVGQEGYGLQVMEKKVTVEDVGGDAVDVEMGGDGPEVGEPEKPKTEDEIALEALVSGEAKKKSTLILAPTGGNLGWRETRAQMSLQDEADAYKADIALRPDAPSLDAYEAVPVEEFGAALLRGMGWKEGMELGKGARGKKVAAVAAGRPKIVERRPALLGLGAKTKEEAMAVELGAWGKGEKAAGGKKKSGWVDKTYVPVVLRNKLTGEIVDTPPPAPLGRSGGEGRDGRNGNGEAKGREAELRERDRDSRPGSRRDRGDGEDTDGSEKRRRWGDVRDKSREVRRSRDDQDSRRDGERDRGSGRDRDSGRDWDWRRDDERGSDRRGDDDRDRDRDRRRDNDRDRRRDSDRDRDRRRDDDCDRKRDHDRDRRRDDDRDRRRRSRDRR